MATTGTYTIFVDGSMWESNIATAAEAWASICHAERLGMYPVVQRDGKWVSLAMVNGKLYEN
jgi:hypothetical protein